MTLINIVAPIYNEESVINEFVTQVQNSLSQITEHYKIILIDDGSKDYSWNKIEEICNRESRVVGLKLSKNFGHHYAITAGIHMSEAEWVVVMDSDLQDRPEVIPELFNKAKEGYEVVFVSRKLRPESLAYRIAQKFFYFILQLFSGMKFDSTQANYSIISRKVVEAFKQFPEQARFYGSTINWLGFKKASIDAAHGKRFAGKPSYTFNKRIKLASDIILAFSERPLKFAIFIGLTMGLISLFVLIWIFIRVSQGGFSVTGWASLIASVFLIGGVQITLIGIIGIYLSKVFGEVKRRPLFIIEQIKNNL
jgi:glycosyltransferase involved in cell wall biosynthesis